MTLTPLAPYDSFATWPPGEIHLITQPPKDPIWFGQICSEENSENKMCQRLLKKSNFPILYILLKKFKIYPFERGIFFPENSSNLVLKIEN
jgi:hypothetical protein